MLSTIDEKCCGCSACIDICPHNAIKMTVGYCGYRVPKVDIKKCVDCGMCNSICPVNDIKSYQVSQLRDCYAARVISSNDLLERTSGGIATEIAVDFIRTGKIVYGVSYSENFKSAQHIRIDSLTELKQIIGTKYVQAENESVYRKIAKDLSDKEKVLFIGLPCEVAAVRKYVKNLAINLYTCELVCHGPASPKVLSEYVEYLEERCKSKVKKFNVRYKKDGWKTPYLKADFENGFSFLKEFYYTEYGEAFYLQGRQSCYDCKFKAEHSQADITLGDYWGIEDKDVVYDKNGVSICFIHSQKGEEIFSGLANVISQKILYSDAIKNNEDVFKSRKIHNKTELFCKCFDHNGLIKSCFLIKPLKQKIKIIIKSVITRVQKLDGTIE